MDCLGGCFSDARHLTQLGYGRLSQFRHRTECAQQRCNPCGPEPRHRFELRPNIPASRFALCRDRKPVGLVAQPLHEKERLG